MLSFGSRRGKPLKTYTHFFVRAEHVSAIAFLDVVYYTKTGRGGTFLIIIYTLWLYYGIDQDKIADFNALLRFWTLGSSFFARFAHSCHKTPYFENHLYTLVKRADFPNCGRIGFGTPWPACDVAVLVVILTGRIPICCSCCWSRFICDSAKACSSGHACNTCAHCAARWLVMGVYLPHVHA